MEGEGDNFLKALQKKQRALVKKLERIKKKQAEVKASGKEVKEDEKKLIESEPLILELLQETEKTVQQYKQHLESAPKSEKKVVVKEEDRSKDVFSLWLLGDFLSIQQVKEKFIRENPEEVQDLDAFLLLHSQSKGQTGKKFSETLTETEKSVEHFLGKTDKVAPGTLRTYKKLAEFEKKALNWASGIARPQTPPKAHVEHVPAAEVRAAEEVKSEVKEIREQKDVKPEPVAEPKQSGWAYEDDEDDDLEESKHPQHKEVSKKDPEDEGFITVTKRSKPSRNEEREADRGERRGRGQRGGRGRGRGKWEGEEREQGEEFRGERRRGGRRGRGRDRVEGAKEGENRD